MPFITINQRISYIEASDNPLSADIGVIQGDGGVWLYDVGNGEKSLSGLTGEYHVVLSHFHADHTGNIQRIQAKSLYVSKETYAHVHRGVILQGDMYIGDMRIFPLPSSHTKGCLGLEVGESYAFVGDALYCKAKDGFYVYNAQLLRDEIAVLSALRSPYLLVSHYKGLIRKKEDALEELKAIYAMREKGAPEIKIKY